MLILLGASCSGKSSIERKLAERGFNRIISYTSRPIRSCETNHIDYHFISDEEFLQKLDSGFFVEDSLYNSWHYGIAKEDCKDDAIGVVEVSGFRQLKKNENLHITSFFIKTEERERVTRMMKRGDKVLESFRRIISDQGMFSGIEREVDYVVENPDGKLNDAVQEIYNIINTLQED